MTIPMNLKKRQIIVVIGGIFGAGFVHSLLSPGNIWIRAALTAATAIVIVGLSSWLLRHLPDPAHRMPTRWILAGTVPRRRKASLDKKQVHENVTYPRGVAALDRWRC